MGLRSIVDNAVGIAFKAAGDIPRELTYNSIIIAGYDTQEGTTETTTNSHEKIQYFYDNYKASEIDGTVIKPHDQRILIRASQLPVKPMLTDTVTIDGEIWNVLDYKPDTAGATWTFQLRRA